MKRRLLIGAFVAGMLAFPAMAYAWNSNPLCYLVIKGSIEWDVLWCDATEHAEGEGG
jgi:hypothetical protein